MRRLRGITTSSYTSAEDYPFGSTWRLVSNEQLLGSGYSGPYIYVQLFLPFWVSWGLEQGYAANLHLRTGSCDAISVVIRVEHLCREPHARSISRTHIIPNGLPSIVITLE